MSQTLDFEHLVGLCRRAHQETQRSTARAVDRYLVTPQLAVRLVHSSSMSRAVPTEPNTGQR